MRSRFDKGSIRFNPGLTNLLPRFIQGFKNLQYGFNRYFEALNQLENWFINFGCTLFRIFIKTTNVTTAIKPSPPNGQITDFVYLAKNIFAHCTHAKRKPHENSR